MAGPEPHRPRRASMACGSGTRQPRSLDLFRVVGLSAIVFYTLTARACSGTIIQFGGTSSELGYGAGFDSTGNYVYISGQTSSSDLGNQTSAGGTDFFVAKYTLEGDLVWLRQNGTSSTDEGYGGLAVGGSGGQAVVYVTGYTQGTFPGENKIGSTYDYFVAKYDNSGNVVWLRQHGAAGSNAYSNGVAADTNGDAFVTGYTGGALSGQTNLGGNDYFVARHNGTDGDVVWVRQYGGSSGDVSKDIAVDGGGYVYIAGSSQSSFGGRTTSAGQWDAFVMKYNSTDGSLVWTSWFSNGGGTDTATSVSVGSDGNLYVAGHTEGTLVSGQPNAGGYDYFAAKFNSSGVMVWIVQNGTTGTEYGEGVAVDSSGAVYVVGMTEGTLNTSSPNQGGFDFYLAQYNSSGHLQHVIQDGTADGDDRAYECAISDDGSVIAVVGWVAGSLENNTHYGSNDYFLDLRAVPLFSATSVSLNTTTEASTYDAGTDIVIQNGTSSNDYAMGVSFDSDGHMYVAGYTAGALYDQMNAGGYDMFLGKYTAGGSLLWGQMNGTGLEDIVQCLAVGGSGGQAVVYVTGYTQGTFPGENKIGSTYDYFVAKYDNSGNVVWLRQHGAAGSYTHGYGVAFNSVGDAFVTGYTGGALSGQTNLGGNDYFVARHNGTDGDVVWVRQYGGSSGDYCLGIAAGASGYLYLACHSESSFDGRSNVGLMDAFVAKYNATDGSLVWTSWVATTAIDYAWAVNMDAEENVYVAGYTEGSLVSGQSNAGGSDYMVAKFNSSGDVLWITQNGSVESDFGRGVAVDGDGRVYVVGMTGGTLGGGGTSYGGNDYFVAQYNSSGQFEYVGQRGTAGTDAAYDCAISDDGSVIAVVGWVAGSLENNTHYGSNDYFLDLRAVPLVYTTTVNATTENSTATSDPPPESDDGLPEEPEAGEEPDGTSKSVWVTVGDTILGALAVVITTMIANAMLLGCLSGCMAGGMSGLTSAAGGAGGLLGGAGSGGSSISNSVAAANQPSIAGILSLVFTMQSVGLLSWLNVQLPESLDRISIVMSWLTLNGDLGIRDPTALSRNEGHGHKLLSTVDIDTHGSAVLFLTALAWASIVVATVACIRGAISCGYHVVVKRITRVSEISLDPLFWFPKLELMAFLFCYQGVAVSVGAVLYDGSPLYVSAALVVLLLLFLAPAAMALFLSHHVHSRKNVNYTGNRILCSVRIRKACAALVQKHICRRNGLGEDMFPLNVLAWKGEVDYWLFNMGAWNFKSQEFENRFDFLFSDYKRHSYLFLPFDMTLMTLKAMILGCVTGAGAGTMYGQIAALMVIDGIRLVWLVVMKVYNDGQAALVDIYSNATAILSLGCALGLPLENSSNNLSVLESWLGAWMTFLTMSALMNKTLYQLLRGIAPMVALIGVVLTQPAVWLRMLKTVPKIIRNTWRFTVEALTFEGICHWERRRQRRRARKEAVRKFVWEIVEKALEGCADPEDPLYKVIGVDSGQMFPKPRRPRPRRPANEGRGGSPPPEQERSKRDLAQVLRKKVAGAGRLDPTPAEIFAVNEDPCVPEKADVGDDGRFGEYFGDDMPAAPMYTARQSLGRSDMSSMSWLASALPGQQAPPAPGDLEQTASPTGKNDIEQPPAVIDNMVESFRRRARRWSKNCKVQVTSNSGRRRAKFVVLKENVTLQQGKRRADMLYRDAVRRQKQAEARVLVKLREEGDVPSEDHPFDNDRSDEFFEDGKGPG